MLAVGGGLVVLLVGYGLVNTLRSADIEDVPVIPISQKAPKTVPDIELTIVPFDGTFFKSGNDFYIRLDSGIDDGTGKKTYKYIKIDIADAKTFHKVPVLGDRSGSLGQGGGTRPGFYMDSKQVYFFSGTSVVVVAGADPDTFQVLSATYASDVNNVYVVNTQCDSEGNCTGTLSIIPGADPDTFQTFHETKVPDPDGSGTVTIDASDDGNIYYYGIWVGPLPDPDDHSVHPDTDTPVLISP